MRESATLRRLRGLGSVFLSDRPWEHRASRFTPILLLTLSSGVAGALTGAVQYEWCDNDRWLHGDGFVWDAIEHFAALGLAIGLAAGTAIAASRHLLIRITLAAALGILLVALAFHLYSEGRPVYLWGTGSNDRESPLFQKSLEWGLYLGGPSAAALSLTGLVLRRTSGKLKLQFVFVLMANFVAIRSQSFFWETWDYYRTEACGAPCHANCHHLSAAPDWVAGLFLVLSTYTLQLWVDLLTRLLRRFRKPGLVPLSLTTAVVLVVGGLAWAGDTMPLTPISGLTSLRFSSPETFQTLHEGEARREWRIREGDKGGPPTVELVRTQRLRRGAFRCSSYALGSTLAAAGTYDGHVAVWDSGTWKPLANFKAADQGIGRVRISADGSLIAAAQGPSRIRIWKLEENYAAGCLEPRTVMDLEPDPSGAIVSFDFLPRGPRIVTITSSGFLKVYDVDQGRLKLERDCVKIRSRDVEAPVFADEGNLLAYLARDGVLLLEDLKRQESRAVRGWWAPLCFSPDCRLLAASRSNQVQIIEVASGKPVRTLARPSTRTFAAFSPDGRWLILADEESTFELIECRTLRSPLRN